MSYCHSSSLKASLGTKKGFFADTPAPLFGLGTFRNFLSAGFTTLDLNPPESPKTGCIQITLSNLFGIIASRNDQI